MIILVVLAQVVQSGYTVVDVSQGQSTGQLPPDATVFSPHEMLTNRGFETGALPPWYQMSSTWVVTTIFPHSGTYCATDVGNYWIRQDFATPIPTDSIVSITFWSRQPDNQIQAFDLMYSDGTYYEWIVWPTVNWQQFNVTSYLTMGKLMVGFRLWGYVGGGPAPDSTYIDDISIIANDPLYTDLVEEGGKPAAPRLLVTPSVFRDAARVSLEPGPEGPADISVYSATGSLVAELHPGQGQAVLLGSGLGPGVYLVIASWEGGEARAVVTKQ